MRLLEVVNPNHWAREWLASLGASEWLTAALTITFDTIILVLIAWISDWISKKIFVSVAHWLVKKSKSKWDDYFFEQKVFRSLAHLIPTIIIFYSLDLVFDDIPKVIPYLKNFLQITIVVLAVVTINRGLKALETLLNNDEKYANSPLRTASQVVRIIVFFIAVVFIISILTGVQLASLLGIMAGTSAILILIFQDTINGLLANLQITMYDLVRVGDWVTLDKYGADGDVQAINLTTVQIRNFDKTISSVPAKAFVSDSFVNWRGMKEAEGRRIKRNIIIDISSIRFCTPTDIEKFSSVEILKDYVTTQQATIDEHNKKNKLTNPQQLNGRVQSNIGVYRNYVLNYLKNHPHVDPDFTMMVRQLQPTAEGVPIEVYCFANTTVWTKYELIQADLFDHLYAATEFFSLHLYQAPSGKDFRAFAKNQ